MNRVGKKYKRKNEGSTTQLEVLFSYPDGKYHAVVYNSTSGELLPILISDDVLVSWYEEVLPKFEVGKRFIYNPTGEHCTVLCATEKHAVISWDKTGSEGLWDHDAVRNFKEVK